MNWEAIGAVGEILGAVAVLVTLLYLARQLKHTATAVETQTQDSALDNFTNLNILVATQPETADLLLRGHFQPGSLSELEGVQYSFLLRAYVRQWDKLFRMYRAGALSKDQWSEYALVASQILDTPGGQVFREQNPIHAALYAEVDRHSTEERVISEGMTTADGGDA